MKPYRSMTLEPAFCEWVADTVLALSGIDAKHLRALAEKQSLTVEESRMVACQGGLSGNSNTKNPASMRYSAEVSTSVLVCNEKRP